MAATNRLDVLDDALCRPGRFDRVIHVGKPSAAGRQAVLQVMPFHPSFSLTLSLCPSLPRNARISPLLSVPLSLCPSVAREFLGVEGKKYEGSKQRSTRKRGGTLKETGGASERADSRRRRVGRWERQKVMSAQGLLAPRAKAGREGLHRSTRLEGAVSCKL